MGAIKTVSKVSLDKLGEAGVVASVIVGENKFPIICRRTKAKTRAVCKDAASRLRLLADLFDQLAEFDEPLLESSQKIVNRKR